MRIHSALSRLTSMPMDSTFVPMITTCSFLLSMERKLSPEKTWWRPYPAWDLRRCRGFLCPGISRLVILITVKTNSYILSFICLYMHCCYCYYYAHFYCLISYRAYIYVYIYIVLEQFPQQVSIQQWHSLGLSEADYLDQISLPFRYTTYVSKNTASLPGPPQNPKDFMEYSTRIVDRSGGDIEKAFSAYRADPSLFDQLRIPFNMQLKSEMGVDISKPKDQLSLFIFPEAAPGISLIPQSPSIKDMLQEVKTYLPSIPLLDGQIVGKLEREILKLINLDLVTVWIPHDLKTDKSEEIGSVGATALYSGGKKNDMTQALSEHERRQADKRDAMRKLNFDEEVIRAALQKDDELFRKSLSR